MHIISFGRLLAKRFVTSICFLLSLFVPGSFFIYKGATRKAWYLLLLWLLVFCFFCWSRLILLFPGFVCYLVIHIAIYVCAIIWPLFISKKESSKQQIQQLNEEIVAHKSTWFFKAWFQYPLFICVFTTLWLSLHLNRSTVLGIEPFRIPSESMLPTLHPWDFIMVDTWAYRFNPVSKGDIVVFKKSVDYPHFYIKRVIASEHDLLRITHGQLFINDQKRDEPYLTQSFVSSVYEQTIPPKHSYMLGDNRNYSQDSRYFGSIANELVQGKAVFIWLALDSNFNFATKRIGQEL